MVYIYIRKIQSGTSHTTSDEVSGHCFSNNSHLHTGTAYRDIFAPHFISVPITPSQFGAKLKPGQIHKIIISTIVTGK